MSYLGNYSLSGDQPEDSGLDSFLQDQAQQKYSQQLAANQPQMDEVSKNVGMMKAGVTAATMPFMLTPTGAAVGIGSQLIMQKMAQDAADARAKRERAAAIAQQQGQSEQSAIQTMVNSMRGL